MHFSENYKRDPELSVDIEKVNGLLLQAKQGLTLPLTRTAICRNVDYIDIEIPQTFDKKYYVSEEYVRMIGKQTSSPYTHLVRFQLFELEEIVKLLHCLGDKIGYNTSPESAKYPEVIEFLNKNHPAYILSNAIYEYLREFGTGPSVYYAQPISEARTFINNFRKRVNNEIESIYSILLQNKRIPITWKSEYELYSLVKRVFPDTCFQYKADWLSKQSLDIYIPSLKVAIEYQGKQHYEPVVFLVESRHMLRMSREIEKKLNYAKRMGLRYCIGNTTLRFQ